MIRDRDGIYGHDFTRRVDALDMKQALLAPRSPWRNAVVESFLATLKLELVFRRTFRTRREARQAVFNYIEVFHDRQRRHSYLGHLGTRGFEQLAESAELVAWL